MTTRLDLSATTAEHVLIPHAHTERALDEAAALDLSPDEVAKTIVLHVTVRGDLTIGTTWARAVLPAGERLDLHKLREFFGESRDVRLASEAELAEVYPEFELGAVPPFGGRMGDVVLVDPLLAAKDFVAFEAGTHDQSVRMKTEELIELTHATVVGICQD